MNRLKPSLPYLCLIAASGVLIFGIISNGHHWGGDFSSYIMQARSLIEGTPSDFVEANSFTIDNTERKIGPHAYPWGTPVLLAPVYALCGTDIVALKSMCIVFYLAFLATLALGFRRQHTGVWRICLVGLFAFSPPLLMYLNHVGSDIPFLFFSTLSVLLLVRVVVDHRPVFTPAWDAVLLGALFAVSFFIRSNGIVLPATLAVSQLWIVAREVRLGTPLPTAITRLTTKAVPHTGSGVPRALWIACLPYLSFGVLAFIWGRAFPDGGSAHMDYMSQISPGKIKYNFFYYGKMPQEFYEGVPLPFVVYLATLPLMLLGMVKRWRCDHPMAVYMGLTALLYLLWPIAHTFRYLYPILPFYISFTLTGMESLRNTAAFSRSWRRAIPLAPVLVVLVCFVLQTSTYAYDNLARGGVRPSGPYTQASQEMFEFVRQEIELDATICFFKPRVMRFLTDRKSYMTRDVDKLELADYLIVHLHEVKQLSPKDAEGLSEQGLANLIYENRDFRVYRLDDS